MRAGTFNSVVRHLAYAMAGRALDITSLGGDVRDPQAWCASELEEL
jgi:hypothetical protein